MENKITSGENERVDLSAESAPKAKKQTKSSPSKGGRASSASAKKPASTRSRKTAKTAVSEKVFLQFGGHELDMSELIDRAKSEYAEAKGGAEAASDVRLYVKPEDSKAYYVVNDTFAGEIELF